MLAYLEQIVLSKQADQLMDELFNNIYNENELFQMNPVFHRNYREIVLIYLKQIWNAFSPR